MPAPRGPIHAGAGGLALRIEILSIPGCPNHANAVELVRQALSSAGVRAEILEILVEDNDAAARLSFPGSPTIRINHRDVEPLPSLAGSFALQCRLYVNPEAPGLPRQDSVVRAIRVALREEAS